MYIQTLYSKVKKPLYENAFHLILNTVMITGLGFFFWVIVARFYPPDEVGLGSALISTTVLLGLLSGLGFKIAFIRFLPQSRNGTGIINSCFTINIVIAAALCVVFWSLRNVVASSIARILDYPVFFAVFVVFVIVRTLTINLDGVFIAKRVAKYTLFKNAAFGILKIPLPIFATGFGAFGILFSWGISALILYVFAMAVFVPKVQADYRPKLAIQRVITRDLIRFSIGNYIAEVFSYLPGLALPLMIANILVPSMAAYFYVTWMIAGLLNIIPRATAFSFLAEASLDENNVRGKIIKSFKFIFLLLIPGIIVISLLAGKLLLLFGEPYAENGALLLRMLAISSIPFAFNTVYVAWKNVKKEVGKVAGVNGFIAISTLLLSYLLMGSMGLVGVGIGWIASNLAINLALMGLAVRYVVKG